jgi:hypothetical protein
MLYFYRLPNTTHSSRFQINSFIISHLSHACYTLNTNRFSQYITPIIMTKLVTYWHCKCILLESYVMTAGGMSNGTYILTSLSLTYSAPSSKLLGNAVNCDNLRLAHSKHPVQKNSPVVNTSLNKTTSKQLILMSQSSVTTLSVGVLNRRLF